MNELLEENPYAPEGTTPAATMPPPATVQVIPAPTNDVSSKAAFMRTVDENVTTMMRTQLMDDDPNYHYTTISADDVLAISRLKLMGYSPAPDHPHVDEKRGLAVYKMDRAEYEAKYELECKTLDKKLRSSPSVDSKKMDKAGKDPYRIIENLPEKSYAHEESMQQLIDDGSAERFEGFNPDEQ